jgi:tRNA (cytidine/uridine-2'-O-)-methyltransferase
MPIRIALYQPDIPGNTGTILRMAACFDLEVHVIEPAGFDLSDRALKRSGMDYLEQASLHRHVNWNSFEADCLANGRRMVLFSTSSQTSYVTFKFDQNDMLLFGRESSGVPADVHERANARLVIPMRPDRRSLNLALSVAMATGEALRQLGAL